MLVFAAKAAGIPKKVVGAKPGLYALNKDEDGVYGLMHQWNPILDDGDAFRLAVKIGLCIGPNFDNDRAVVFGLDGKTSAEPHGADPYGATRLAITRAAAAIGEQMP